MIAVQHVYQSTSATVSVAHAEFLVLQLQPASVYLVCKVALQPVEQNVN